MLSVCITGDVVMSLSCKSLRVLGISCFENRRRMVSLRP